AEPSSTTETKIGNTVGPTVAPTGTWMPNTPASAKTPRASMRRAKTSSPRGTRGADRVLSVRPLAPVVGAGMSDQPEVLQRAGDSGDVLLDEVVQLLTGQEGVRPSLGLQLASPGVRIVHLGDDPLQLRALGIRDPAGG